MLDEKWKKKHLLTSGYISGEEKSLMLFFCLFFVFLNKTVFPVLELIYTEHTDMLVAGLKQH